MLCPLSRIQSRRLRYDWRFVLRRAYLNFVITRASIDPVCPSSVYFSMVQKKYDAYVPHDLCRPVNRQMSVLKERVAKQDCVGVGVKYTFIDNDKRTRIRRMLWSSGTRLLNPF